MSNAARTGFTPGAALDGLPRSLRTMFNLLSALRRGALTVTTPDGRRFAFNGAAPGPVAELIVRRPRFVRRALMGGNVGLAEAYMDGDWDTPDLAALLQLLCVNDATDELGYGRRIATFAHRLYHLLRANTKRGSKRNIAAHYDLGNDFYALWLDPSMTYSSAVFPEASDDLEAAQRNKYRLVCEKLGLAPGRRVLEIGCGWGGFASFAAREYGAQVTGVTVSRAQQDFALARMQREGLNDKVEIRLIDYRDLTGSFDAIASIEMFEAVGERYWPQYFATLRDRLVPGGRAALQIITIADRWFERYRRGADFIQRYIFPGGMLPSPAALQREVARVGLTVERQEFFGLHYARTLAKCNADFQVAWGRIAPMGYDLRFKRMWEFYLAYCEAGFRAGTIDVTQIGLAK